LTYTPPLFYAGALFYAPVFDNYNVSIFFVKVNDKVLADDFQTLADDFQTLADDFQTLADDFQTAIDGCLPESAAGGAGRGKA
jgi:hypothetical protein